MPSPQNSLSPASAPGIRRNTDLSPPRSRSSTSPSPYPCKTRRQTRRRQDPWRLKQFQTSPKRTPVKRYNNTLYFIMEIPKCQYSVKFVNINSIFRQYFHLIACEKYKKQEELSSSIITNYLFFVIPSLKTRRSKSVTPFAAWIVAIIRRSVSIADQSIL